MTKQKLLFGVHNNKYNLDFYDDNSIEIYNYITKKLITVFDEEVVALFMTFLQRDGHLDELLEIETERLRKWKNE